MRKATQVSYVIQALSLRTTGGFWEDPRQFHPILISTSGGIPGLILAEDLPVLICNWRQVVKGKGNWDLRAT
jgi:hypothetical protein